jgi:hypothetical protein
MTLVRNHQQQLSGNKLLALLVAIIFMASCSPKVTKPVVEKQPAKPSIEEPVIKKITQANVSVFIPFELNKFNLKTLTKSQVEKADMSLDFYQGLLMGIDSAANGGLNFKVNVYDTKDAVSEVVKLTKKEAVQNSHLFIGPIFPDGIKAMSAYSKLNKIPMVSPLAASKPTEFNNPYLVSVINAIDAHGVAIADYIAKHYDAEESIVVLINTQKSSDLQLANPIKERFKVKHPKFVVQEYSSTHVLETKMQKGKRYAVIMCSDDSKFVIPSLTKLYRLKTASSYPIQVFGHPNWQKQSYNVDQLQNLQTIVSTSNYINYTDKSVINFVKIYREKYEIEPSEFAFKGFDVGFYFGKLLNKYGASYFDYLLKETYKGLNNDFKFGYDAEFGFYNKHLMLLQYKNLSLQEVN